MATPPYAKLRVARNGGAAASGAIACAAADSIQLSLESTVGVGKARWEIWEYPTGFTVPAGWTEDPSTHVYYSLLVSPPAFTLPAATTGIWGKWMLRVLVNDGDPGTTGLPAAQLLDESTAIEIVGPGGLRDVPYFEGSQFDAQRTWVGALKIALRIIGLYLAIGAEVANAASGAAATLDFGRSLKWKLTLTSNCTLTLTAPAQPCEKIFVKLVQDGTGSRTVTWPASVKWSGGTAPTLTTTAGRTDCFELVWDGTQYIARTVGLNYTLT
jgi:hypothetical protein